MGLFLICPHCQAKTSLASRACPTCGADLRNLPPKDRCYFIGKLEAAEAAPPAPAMVPDSYPAALEVLHHLVTLYPSSLDGPWNLANLHRLMGDTATAIRYYEECLRREPNMVPAGEWLRRLRGGG